MTASDEFYGNLGALSALSNFSGPEDDGPADFAVDLEEYRAAPTVAEQPAADDNPLGPADFGIDLSDYLPQADGRPEAEAFAPVDPATHTPGIVYDIPSESVGPGEIHTLGTAEQRTLAISRIADPAAQINMFARAGDIKNMINLSRQYDPAGEKRTIDLAKMFNVSEEFIDLIQRHEPDRLKARADAYRMMEIAGPDGYLAKQFSADPKYAATWRDSMMQLADISAAVDSMYASKPEIMGKQFLASLRGAFVNLTWGTLAGASQAVRDLRDMPPEMQEEMPIPEGMMQDDYLAYALMDSMNRDILERNEHKENLQTDPAAVGYGRIMGSFLDGVDDSIQRGRLNAEAKAYMGNRTTGEWAYDSAGRPVVEGLASLALSAIATIATGGTTAAPALFGGAAAADAYREQRADDVDPRTAFFSSLGLGVAEFGMEKISLDAWLDSPGIQGLWRGARGHSNTLRARAGRVLGGAIRSSITEGVTEMGQTAAEQITAPIGRSISLGDPIENIWNALDGREIALAGWGGAGSAFLAGGIGGNSIAETAGMVEYNRFQRSTAVLSKTAADLTKTHGVEEVRGEIRNMAREAVANGDKAMTSTVFADAGDVESFLQGMPEAEAQAALDSLDVSRATFEQAVENNIDIEVPLENVVVGKTIADPAFLKLFRPSPSLPTAAAMQQSMAATREAFDLAKRLQSTMEEDIARGIVPAEIVAMRGDLMNMRLPAKDADAIASLYLAWGQAQAKARGIDIDAYFADHSVRAAMDAFIKNNPQWLLGALSRQPEGATTSDQSIEFDPVLDPAMGEAVEADFSERAGVEDAAFEPTVAEPGGDAAGAVAPGRGGGGGPDGGAQAAQPQRRLFEIDPAPRPAGGRADALTGLPYSMETVNTSGIKAAPELFQFKRSSDEATGVKKGQEIPGDVDPAALGTMVLYEDVDGQRFVVSGHHRLDLLRRNSQNEDVRAAILREADGWTTDQARAYGAALNIKEGGGDIDDYATFFRESRGKLTREKAEGEGLLRRDNARTGYAIGALGSDNVFYGYLNEELSPRRAAAIALAAPSDPDVQDLMIERNIPTNELETFAGYAVKMKNTGALDLGGVQLSLFSGADHQAMLAAMQRESREAAKEAANLDKQANSLEGLLKAGKNLTTRELHKYGARAGNRESVRTRIAELRGEAARWRRFFQHPDILAQVQERAETAPSVETYAQELRPDDAKLADAASKTMEFVEKAIANPKENQPFVEIIEVSEEAVAKAKEQAGFDFSGFTHGMDGSWVRHALKEHGVGKEKQKSQAPIDARTFGLYPLVVSAPDIVQRRSQTHYDTEVVRFGKNINGMHYVVEEVREGKKRLGFLDMYRKKDKSSAQSVTSETRTTSETPARSTRLPHAEDSSSTESASRPTSETPPTMEGRVSDVSDSIPADNVPGETDFVKPDETFEQSERGRVELYKATPQHRAAAVIRVMRGGDMSTILHELGHIFLADMRDYVNSGDAGVAAVRDYGRLLSWAGDLTQTENVEKVARGFEEYLRDGKAPSLELVNSFGRFSSWLSRIYGNIRQYVGLDLDPKVRGVFDRWLASGEQIREAELYYQGMGGNHLLNLLGDDEEKRKVEERIARNRERIKARYASELASGRVQALEDAEGTREAIQESLRARPVYQALERAQAVGLDRETATGMVGEQIVQDIVDRHGNVFRKAGDPAPLKPILAKAGYYEANSLTLFLEDLAKAVPIAEAVAKDGPHVRRKRVYEALSGVRDAGGIDMAAALDAASESDIDTIIQRHGENVFRPDRSAAIDGIALENGFDSGDVMLAAMAATETIDDAVEREVDREATRRERESRRWATEAVDVFADSALHHPDEDIAAENIDITREALFRALSAEQKRRQQFVERRVITDRARKEVERLTLRESANFGKWAMAERRWSARAAEAAAVGNREAALAALDKQQYLHAMVTEAYRVRQERQRFTNKYLVRTARSELATVKYEYREAIKDILTSLNIITSRTFQPDHSDPGRVILPVESDGMTNEKGRAVDEDLDIFLPPLETVIERWILDKKLPEDYQGLNDLTAVQMRQVDDAVNVLMNRGRGALHALKSDQAQTQEQLKNAVMTVMDALPDYKRRDRRTWLGRKLAFGESYVVNNLMIDRIAAEADGNPTLQGREMGMMQNLIRQIRMGEVDQMQLLDDFRKESADDFAVVDGMARRLKREFGSKFFPVDGMDMPAIIQRKKGISTFDADMLVTIMYNVGNRDNLFTLQEGYGFTDQDLQRIASLATAAEWRAVQNIGQRLDRFFPLMDEIYFRQNNKHLAKVEPTPFVVEETADGQTLYLDGWYYPKVYDPELNDRSGQLAELDDFRAMMQAIHSPTRPVDSFTRGRAVDEDGNPVVTRPLLLRSSVLVDHLTNASRWVTHAEPLLEFRRLTMDSDFKDMFIQKLGAEKYRYLREWTNRMARPNKSAGRLDGLFSSLRNMSTVAALGFNMRSALRQAESLGIAADKMSLASRDKSSGWWWLLQGFKEMGAGGLFSGWIGRDSDAVRRMHEHSSMAEARSKNVNKEIRDLTRGTDPTRGRERKVGGLKLSRDMFFHFTYAMDGWISGMCWWGAYHQAMNGHAGFDTKGLTDAQIQAKAVAFADDVLLSQQSPFQADYTAVQADKGPISLFTQFMGGVTPYLSHTAGVGQAWRRGQISSSAAARHLANTYAIPVLVKLLIADLLRRALTGDDDEDESFGRDFAWGMVEGMTAPLPGVRDVAGVIKYGERSATIPSISTPARSLLKVGTAAGKLTEGEVAAAASEFGKVLAVYVPVYNPARQAWQAGEALGLIEESE